MIKPTELRIGNWVKSNDLWLTVSGISATSFTATHQGRIYFNMEDIQPIPLTEEWLRKLGFSCVEKKCNQGAFKVYTKEPLTFNTLHGWWLRSAPFENVLLKYIHQLQNLYFALTGEKITVK